MTTTPERRPQRAPLRFDWQTIPSPTMGRYYRAHPDSTFYLQAFKSGGAWRWTLGMRDTLDPPIVSKSAPTLTQAKHDAETWYRDHGGRPAQTTMNDVRHKDDERSGDPAPF